MSGYGSDRRRAATGAALLLAGVLAGCGMQGSLERPAPLFGSARADYEAQRAQEARDDAQRQSQLDAGEERPRGEASSTRDVLDPNQRLAPASTDPMPGTPNPFGRTLSPIPGR